MPTAHGGVRPSAFAQRDTPISPPARHSDPQHKPEQTIPDKCTPVSMLGRRMHPSGRSAASTPDPRKPVAVPAARSLWERSGACELHKLTHRHMSTKCPGGNSLQRRAQAWLDGVTSLKEGCAHRQPPGPALPTGLLSAGSSGAERCSPHLPALLLPASPACPAAQRPPRSDLQEPQPRRARVQPRGTRSPG